MPTSATTFLSKLRSGRGLRVALAVAVVALGIGVGLWGAEQGGSPPPTTATAKPGTVKEEVAEPAIVEDVSQADVNSDVSGDVQSLDVRPGDYVYADETLATTDPYSDNAALYEDSVALNQDETQLASDESNQSLQSADAQVATDEQGVSTDQAAASAAQAAQATPGAGPGDAATGRIGGVRG